MEELKNQILKLEKDLLRPEIRQSSEKINELLWEGFTEFCSSGCIYCYNKEEAIEENTDLEEINWEIKDFQIDQLSSDVILAKYKVIKHSEINENKKYSLRSSIWKYINGKWKMVFHQGTLTSKF